MLAAGGWTVLLLVVAIVVGTPILWAVSVGALRQAHLARRADPRAGCQAWVAVPGMRGRLYRCGEPLYAGGPWCRAHEVAELRGQRRDDPDAVRIDEPQAVGRALAQARVGVPVAVVTAIAALTLVIWALQRAA